MERKQAWAQLKVMMETGRIYFPPITIEMKHDYSDATLALRYAMTAKRMLAKDENCER